MTIKELNLPLTSPGRDKLTDEERKIKIKNEIKTEILKKLEQHERKQVQIQNAKARRKKLGKIAKATQDRKIKELYLAGGITQKKLADRYGVSLSKVYTIIHS